MKKLLSLLLPLALALSLAACGEKSADEAARQTPPTLTVTSANACSVTLKSSSYDWTYTQGLQSMTAIACGAHPLDENCRDITPVLEMPFAVSAAYFYTVTLDFGDNSPDSVSLRCWPSDAWGSTVMPSETVTAQQQDNGCELGKQTDAVRTARRIHNKTSRCSKIGCGRSAHTQF